MARNPNLCRPPETAPILRRADKGVYVPCSLAEDIEKRQDFLAQIAPPAKKRRARR
jgi:hypothetical protein